MSEIPKLDLMDNRPCEHCGSMVNLHHADGWCVGRQSKYLPLGELSTREKLNRVLLKLEPDALKAVLYLSERLLVGQSCYGELDLSTDPRDWKKEKISEVGDLLIYSAFETLKAAMVNVDDEIWRRSVGRTREEIACVEGVPCEEAKRT